MLGTRILGASPTPSPEGEKRAYERPPRRVGPVPKAVVDVLPQITQTRLQFFLFLVAVPWVTLGGKGAVARLNGIGEGSGLKESVRAESLQPLAHLLRQLLGVNPVPTWVQAKVLSSHSCSGFC